MGEFAAAMKLRVALRMAASVGVAEKGPMYGLIVKMVAAAGKREEVISLLLEGTDAMPGCLSYCPGCSGCRWHLDH